MPPLTTPATAILLSIGFFAVLMGIPFLFAGYTHNLSK
jgi:hypothetical protein